MEAIAGMAGLASIAGFLRAIATIPAEKLRLTDLAGVVASGNHRPLLR